MLEYIRSVICGVFSSEVTTVNDNIKNNMKNFIY